MSAPLLASGFVNPWLAGGVGLAAAPIIIHLLSRRRFRRIDWAAMHFLRIAERENRRRVRFEEWLLVALRCLAMALLALVIARPFVQPGLIATLLGGSGQTQRVLVLDDSASLAYHEGPEQDFAALKAAAGRLLAWLSESAQGERVTIYRASGPDEPLAEDVRLGPATLGDLRELLDQLEPAMLPAEPAGVLAAAAAKAQQFGESGRTDLYILSDFQRSDWAPAPSAGGDASDGNAAGGDASSSPFAPLRELDADRLRVLLLAVGSAQRDNVAVTDVELERSQTIAGFPAVCRATVANYAARPLEGASLSVEVDGAPGVPVSLETIEPGAQATVAFELTIPDEGFAQLSVSLGRSDGLAADDAFRLAVRAKPAISVALVNGEPATDPARDEVHYLQTALAPPGMVASGLQVETLAPADLEVADLSARDCVLLCNVGELDVGAAAALRRYVTRGGGLAIFLGDRVDAHAYNELLYRGEFSLLPAELGAVREAGGPDAGVHLLRAEQHPITAMFPEGSAALGEAVTFRRFFRVRPGDGAEADARVLARFTDAAQSPALLLRRVGRGQVLLATTSADMDWHDWPRAIDGSYVVTMLELVHALARREQAPAAVRSGQRLEIAISPDRYAPEGMFRSPLHPDEPAQPARVEDASGGDVDAPLVLAGPRATQLGTWWVDLSDRQAGAIERPLCVNLPVGESDLAAATGGELSSGLGETPHEYVPAGAEFLNRQEESRRELWPTILTVLIVTLMAEQGLAWWFGTPKRGGSRFTLRAARRRLGRLAARVRAQV